ncbi:MFS general substrate transporter [Microthyrium microscopicum]|uniref:MFS general substrate transporter n=1 Tax=Microthyrium microscopicum TaxID=703497 RepID=A0A6A6ULM5_9PEZI|nr:MFS general substrate transporter [Microthyrium microscopicum]
MEETHDEKPAPSSHSRNQILLCFLGMLLMNLVVAIDATALSVAFPAISKDIDASFISIYYTGISFLLAWTVSQPVFASFAALSRRVTISVILVFFMAGIIVSSLAKETWVLILGRAIQGIGAGGIVALTYVLMADLFTLQERAKFISYLTLVYLVGTITGPLIGGGFSDRVSWRWIFWFQMPLTALAMILVPIFTKSVQVPLTKKQILAGIDWVGMTGFGIGLSLFLIIFSASGVSWPWKHWRTIVGLILGALILVATFSLSYLSKMKVRPMIPLVVIKDRTAAINFFGSFSQGMIQCTLVYYLPLFYQTARPFSPLMAGVLLLPMCAISSIFSIVAGQLIARTQRIKRLSVIGWTLFALGLIPLSAGALSVKTPVVGWIFATVLMSIANGFVIVSCPLATQASAEHRSDCAFEERIGIKAMAAALNPFFRALGQVIGVVLGETVISNILKKKLSSDEAANILSIVSQLHSSNARSEQSYLIQAVVDSLNVVWLVLNVVAVVNMLLSFLTKDFKFEPSVKPEPSKVKVDGLDKQ